MEIFRALMTTRQTPADIAHVKALNSIELEFCGGKGGEKKVLEKWRVYHDHLCSRNDGGSVWASKRFDHLVDLLHEMANYFELPYDRVHIKTSSYYPTGLGEIELLEDQNRRLLGEALKEGFKVKVAEPKLTPDLVRSKSAGP